MAFISKKVRNFRVLRTVYLNLLKGFSFRKLKREKKRNTPEFLSVLKLYAYMSIDLLGEECKVRGQKKKFFSAGWVISQENQSIGEWAAFLIVIVFEQCMLR